MAEGVARVDVTRWYRYDELVGILNGWVSAFPKLAALESIGTSAEGRDVWVLTVTNRIAGAAEDKPAMYIDANIHAGEITGCSVVLYTADELLHGYGHDAAITQLLDTRTFYLAPRVQPDGVERYLTTPYSLRSSIRPWPFEEEDAGLTPEDINGDCLIVQMRVEDPNGEWKISGHDARLLVKRRPDELSGTFYRIFTEGVLKEHPGGPVKLARPLLGLDNNRNWPANWSPLQRGGGPFPLSEPEPRAVAAFVEAHRNIVIAQNYHTAGGVILRAPCAVDDSAVPPRDQEVYKIFGEIGEEVTGYPCASVFDSFQERDDAGRRSQSGGFIEWTYDHLGIWSFATELWDIQSRAGIERPANDPMRTQRELTEEDGLKILRFLDANVAGPAYLPWQLFEHPELGPVDIGGFNPKYIRQNAPPEFLLDEAQRNTAFSLRQAAMTPELGFGEVVVEALGNNLYVIRATVENRGFLPTNGSAMALRNQRARPIEVELDGGEVLLGESKQQLGHLQGRSANRGLMMMLGMGKVDNERRVEWLVRGDGPLTLTVRSDMAGTAREVVELG